MVSLVDETVMDVPSRDDTSKGDIGPAIAEEANEHERSMRMRTHVIRGALRVPTWT